MAPVRHELRGWAAGRSGSEVILPSDKGGSLAGQHTSGNLSRRTAAPRPQGVADWPQTARRRRSRVRADVAREACIAPRMLPPTARATGGGNALPTCRYEAVLRPENRQSDGNPWMTAVIGTVSRGR